MKKFLTVIFFSLFLTSLTSCFLFQSHETCPAYNSQNDEKIENQEITEINTEINKA